MKEKSIISAVQFLSYAFILLITLIKVFNIINTITEQIAGRKKELAMLKACDVARSLRGNTVIIGADTCVCLGGKVFGKPQNMAEAEEMLRELSGKTHEVFTGFCIYNCKDGTAVSRAEVTHVTFRVLTDSEIKAYVKTREPMDKAGAYGIQRRGALFIEKIEGDYFNVVGLPLCSLAQALKSEFSIDIIG